MVEFKLIYKNDSEIKYEYYPEGDVNSNAGIIVINVICNNIFVDKLAGRDRKRKIRAVDLNSMRDSINEMRRENGEPLLTEEELPTATEDEIYYKYATHAMNRIFDAYNSGQVLENGTVAWY